MKQLYMNNRSSKIFGNIIPQNIIKQGINQNKKFLKKFGNDSSIQYFFKTEKNETLYEFIGVENLKLSETNEISNDKKYIIVGNIRMGYGHYRISVALASYAKALGYTPLWLDLNSFSETTTTKIISHLNSLYSLGSRLSQKYKLFDKLYWEPLNSEGFRKLTYNSKDQKMTELMAGLHNNLPKNFPYIATHVWPAQAAVHAGFEKVVNIIPDNWPMALHLAEGSIHCTQGYSAYLGYRTLNGFDKKILKPIPKNQIFNTGHFIDYELTSNLELDTQKRLDRLANDKPLRILITVGGAGAQHEFIAEIINNSLQLVENKKIAFYINVGDHKNFLSFLKSRIPELETKAKFYINNWQETKKISENAINNDIEGIHIFQNDEIFEAVYTTNLLMRSTDVMVTKPSELAFYPVPKLLIKRVGGHEAWGAIRSAELGDGTIECQTIPTALNILSLMINDKDILFLMNEQILKNNKIGIYNGAKNAVEIATTNFI